MNEQLTEKEMLLIMLIEIQDQLEELDSVLEASFSDVRSSLNKEEKDKIYDSAQKLLKIETELDNLNFASFEKMAESCKKHTSNRLELELGF